ARAAQPAEPLRLSFCGVLAALPPPDAVATLRASPLLSRSVPLGLLAAWLGAARELLAVGNDDGHLRVVCPGGGEVGSVQLPARIDSLAWDPQGTRLAVGCDDGGLRVLSLPALGRSVEALAAHSGPVSMVEWSPSGRQLATGCQAGDCLIRVVDALTGEVLCQSELQQPPAALGWCCTGSSLAAVAERWVRAGRRRAADSVLHLICARSGEARRLDQGGPIVSVAYNLNGPRIAIGTEDGWLRVVDTTACVERWAIRLRSRVRPVMWDPRGKKLAAACSRSLFDETSTAASTPATLYIVDAESGAMEHKLDHDSVVLAVAWSHTGRHIAASCIRSGIAGRGPS
ncbi:unnamed protein product, partial [Prorocentrum cordatum]